MNIISYLFGPIGVIITLMALAAIPARRFFLQNRKKSFLGHLLFTEYLCISIALMYLFINAAAEHPVAFTEWRAAITLFNQEWTLLACFVLFVAPAWAIIRMKTKN